VTGKPEPVPKRVAPASPPVAVLMDMMLEVETGISSAGVDVPS
jgi:hypothetical protein